MTNKIWFSKLVVSSNTTKSNKKCLNNLITTFKDLFSQHKKFRNTSDRSFTKDFVLNAFIYFATGNDIILPRSKRSYCVGKSFACYNYNEMRYVLKTAEKLKLITIKRGWHDKQTGKSQASSIGYTAIMRELIAININQNSRIHLKKADNHSEFEVRHITEEAVWIPPKDGKSAQKKPAVYEVVKPDDLDCPLYREYTKVLSKVNSAKQPVITISEQAHNDYINKKDGDSNYDHLIDIDFGYYIFKPKKVAVLHKVYNDTDTSLEITKFKKAFIARSSNTNTNTNTNNTNTTNTKTRKPDVERRNNDIIHTVDTTAINGTLTTKIPNTAYYKADFFLQNDGSIRLKNVSDFYAVAHTKKGKPNKLDKGHYCRLQHNMLCLPQEIRKTLRFNNKSTVELDFKALHPTILYSLENKEPPKHIYLYNKHKEPLRRRIAKIVLLIAFNAKTRESGICAAQSALRERYGIRVTQKEINCVVKALEKHHKPIAKYFFSGVGPRLQRIDSQTMINFLKESTKFGIFCLPYHDSVIVAERHEHWARGEMICAYRKALKQVCRVATNILPTITPEVEPEPETEPPTFRFIFGQPQLFVVENYKEEPQKPEEPTWFP